MPSISITFDDPNKIYRKHKLNFWSPTSYYQYDSLLISYYYGRKYPNFREELNISDDIFLMGDSGGYQISTLNATISIRDLCKWYTNNVDIGLILDVPTRDSQGKSRGSRQFEKALTKTKSNIDKMMQYEMDCKLYGVVQGSTYEERQKWIAMLSDYHFDGMAFSGLDRYDPLSVAQIYLDETGHKNIHVLGVGGSKVAPLLYYMSKLYDNIIFDNASYAIPSTLGLYGIPIMNGKSGYLSLGKKSESDIKTLPCNCPVCRGVNNDPDILRGKHTKAKPIVQLLALHNLYCNIRYYDILNSLKDSPQDLITFIKKHSSDRTLLAINFLDHCDEYGKESARDVFRRHFSNLREDRIEQSKLGDWI